MPKHCPSPASRTCAPSHPNTGSNVSHNTYTHDCVGIGAITDLLTNKRRSGLHALSVISTWQRQAMPCAQQREAGRTKE